MQDGDHLAGEHDAALCRRSVRRFKIGRLKTLQSSIQKLILNVISLIGWSGKSIISTFCQSKLHTCPSFEVADSKIAQKSEICEDGKWGYEDGKG